MKADASIFLIYGCVHFSGDTFIWRLQMSVGLIGICAMQT